MVPRKQKLMAAGAVLAVGLGLALLFRRGDEAVVTEAAPALPPAAAAASLVPLAATALNGQFSPLAPTPATTVATSTIPAAGVSPQIGPTTTPTTLVMDETGARPVYVPFVDAAAGDAAASSRYRIHVLQNGDTLERLAERYLGDGARALELFDLNRDVLDNPHLLTLGAELRIPVPAAGEQD